MSSAAPDGSGSAGFRGEEGLGPAVSWAPGAGYILRPFPTEPKHVLAAPQTLPLVHTVSLKVIVPEPVSSGRTFPERA